MRYHAGMGAKVQAKDVGLRVEKARKKRALAVGALVGPLVEPALARAGVSLAQILPHWGAICPLLARHSMPESLRHDVLTVAVASDAVKQELHYMAPQVIESVNMLLGYAAVAKVRMVTRHGLAAGLPKGEKSPRKGAAAAGDREGRLCNNVKDDGLRVALEKLAAHVGNRK